MKDDTKKATHLLSIQVAPGEYKHFAVAEPVAAYVKQLEAYIRNPEKSKLKEVYKGRFK